MTWNLWPIPNQGREEPRDLGLSHRSTVRTAKIADRTFLISAINQVIIRKGKGSRLVGGTRLVVFPRPNRPQVEKATSRDPLSSRDPLPFPLPKEVQEVGGGVPAGRGGPGSKGGSGPGSWYSSAYTVSSSVGIPRVWSPQRAGTPRIFPNKLLTLTLPSP